MNRVLNYDQYVIEPVAPGVCRAKRSIPMQASPSITGELVSRFSSRDSNGIAAALRGHFHQPGRAGDVKNSAAKA